MGKKRKSVDQELGSDGGEDGRGGEEKLDKAKAKAEKKLRRAMARGTDKSTGEGETESAKRDDVVKEDGEEVERRKEDPAPVSESQLPKSLAEQLDTRRAVLETEARDAERRARARQINDAMNEVIDSAPPSITVAESVTAWGLETDLADALIEDGVRSFFPIQVTVLIACSCCDYYSRT